VEPTVKPGDVVIYVASENERTNAPAWRGPALVLRVHEGLEVDVQYVSPQDPGHVVVAQRVPFGPSPADPTKIIRPHWIQATVAEV
jgi:hypothetical protein